MPSKASLLDDVLSRVEVRPRTVSWHSRLPADVLAEVLEIKRRYLAGEMGQADATSLARAMCQSLDARGIPMPQYKQVQRWLRDSLTK